MVASDDPRKDYLARAIVFHFGSNPNARNKFIKNSDDLQAGLCTYAEMDAFLDESSCTILQASLVDKDGKYDVSLANEITVDKTAEVIMHFVKVSSASITIDNIQKMVLMSTMQNPPQSTLYHVMHNIFVPMLIKERSVDERLQQLVQDLDATLGTVYRQSNSMISAGNVDETKVVGILKIEDEASFWYESSGNVSQPQLRERALAFYGIIGQVQNMMKGLCSASAEDVADTLSSVQSKLDDLWRIDQGDLQHLTSVLPLKSIYYPQVRLRRLMELIGEEVMAYTRKKLMASDIWRCSFPVAERELRQAVDFCKNAWLAKVTELLNVDWKQSDRPWSGEVFADEQIQAFIKRLESIIELLTKHNALKALLSSDEQRALNLDKAFRRFADMNTLHINTYSNAGWESAVSEYTYSMQPIEAKISEKLREQYVSHLIPKFEEALADQAARLNDSSFRSKSTVSQPLQLLQGFTKYEELLRIRNIEQILEPERDRLLSMLVKCVTNLRHEFQKFSSQFESTQGREKGSAPAQYTGRNFAGIVSTVAYIGQMQSKLEELCAKARLHMNNLSRTADFELQSSELIKELREAKQKEVNQWADDMKQKLQDRDNPIALKVTGTLMSFDQSNEGRLYVHYSESLVTFTREVRQLAALGCSVPKSFEQEVEKAQRHYQSAVVLKQAAAAYNSMESQIIPCQLPILEKDGLALEAVLREQKLAGVGKQITWDDTKSLQRYTENLQEANRKLSNKIARLRSAHSRMIEITTQLLNTNMVRQWDRWEDGLNQMRRIKDEVEREGFVQTTLWVKHVDHQLYKALNFQYKLGLESCHENLPQMEVKLTFKQRRLTFEPPFEEIKRDYFRELKHFIAIPSQFRGLGDSDMFKNITDRNSEGLVLVFQQAERLFKKLSEISDKFTNWVVLGAVTELDTYVEERLKEVEDWESNFRILKTRIREVEKLPDSEKVDCITVNNTAVKAAIEEHFKAFNEVLCNSLRKSALSDIDVLETFVKNSLADLSVMPESVEEIANATARWQGVEEQCVVQRELKIKMEEKGRLLKVQSNGSVLDAGQLNKDWDELELRMSAHEKNVEEHKDKIRALLQKRVKDYITDLEKFAARWKGNKPDEADLNDRKRAAEVVEKIQTWSEEYDEMKKRCSAIKRECVQTGMPEPNLKEAEYASLDDDITKTLESWGFYRDFLNEMTERGKEDWVIVRERLYEVEDFLALWAEKVRVRVKEKDMDVVVRSLSVEIEKLRANVPVLKYVKGDAFTQEHWSELFKMLNFTTGVSRSNLKLSHLLDVSEIVAKKLPEIQDLQARAVAELTIQDAFDSIQKWSIEAAFKTSKHTDSNNRQIVLIKEWKEIQTQVGDFQSVLQAMRDSPYFQKFAVLADEWDRRFTLLAFALNDLQAIQRKWLYLEPIFGRGALPHEQGRFKRVDEQFRSIMSDVEEDTSVKSLERVPEITERLPNLIDQLDRCQKALIDFLEEKRSKFPRFYFIGDEDLLEILGQSKNPTVIQAHLKKLFQAIYSVRFSEDKKQILAIESLEGEMVELVKSVAVSDNVEFWLAELAAQMVSALEEELSKCMQTLDIPRFPSMILCCADQICFSRDVEKILRKETSDGLSSLKDLEQRQRQQLQQFTSFEQVDNVTLLKLKALVLDLIHNIDVLDQLAKNDVKEVSDWFWQKQLRYYYEIENKCVVVKMCSAVNHYTYEYQGNDPKLVHTPLTDKCYLTLTQALHLGYGGNPYGPAGTGKTESVKALGQALARQVLVFNCDEGIDYKSMGRIFTGLVKCGAWGCFDEFNRLEAEVLSAVSQQIQTIQAALKERRNTLRLLGNEIEVNKNSGIFVTLNPAGKGYLGRSELPDNLKQLFRSVAMAAPDNALIAEVILYSEGYQNAKIIGTKVVELFTLSKQLLSKQQHYDWGLRALKTILLISGSLIQKEKKSSSTIDKKIEMELVIKAVRLNTLAKLTSLDTQRFEELIKDIFPGTEVKDAFYEDLEQAIKESLAELKLKELSSQIKKVVQLNENLNQRMGCVIVGPSGSGKSTLLKILRAALQKMKQPIVMHTMNPKAMPRHQLLGHMDLDTREWFDGVLTASARQVVKEPANVRSWIICDGDIDPEWVESLNSVLDDNRLLTMPSGERIRFGPNVNFIFESNDLKYASPATVSRMGMIFLSDEDNDVNWLVKAWVSRQPDIDLQGKLQDWLDGNDVFEKALAAVLHMKHIVETTKVGIVLNALSHLVGVTCKQQFVCALIRGMGSNVDPVSREALAKEIWQWCNESPLNTSKPLDCYYDDTKAKALVEYKSDFGVDLTVQDMVITSPTETDLPVLGTVDLLKQYHLFSTWLETNEPFLLVGPEGCGKSMLLRYAFQKLRSVEVAMLNCNAQTAAIHVIQKLQQSCTIATSQSGRVYRPKAERLVLYLKNVNLPKPDKYETIQLIAFLQQLVLYQGFYDGLEWMSVERIQIVCSMNPSTTVGRHNLTTRFTAIIRIASITYPEREQLQQVYAAYLNAVIRSRLPSHPIWKDRTNSERLAGTLLDLYDKYQNTFSVDKHRHYQVTPRDISAVVVGLLRYDISVQHVLDVLTYEVQRVFRDRLVDLESATRFDRDVCMATLRSHWKEKSELGNALFSTWLYSASGKEGPNEPAKLGITALGRSTAEDLTALVAQGLQQYEREYKELNILLFAEIIERIAFLNRILTEPGGSALLIGRAGVGRRTCFALTCYMLRMEVFSPKVGRDYKAAQFVTDLKDVLNKAGVLGTPIAVYLEEYQLVEPAILEIVNGLLSSGEVPGMFSSQELDTMLGPLKEAYNATGFKHRNLYAFFVNQVQRNLHLVISLDPTHSDFLLRCESNPALYNRCSILWLDSWTKQGMSIVSKTLLKDTLEEIPNPKKDELLEQVQFIHQTWTERGAAPRQYITLVETIKALYLSSRKKLVEQHSFLGGGLNKLDEAAQMVDKLSHEAQKQQEMLRDKQAQADRAMQEITHNMEDAGRKKKEAEELSSKLTTKEGEMTTKRQEVEAQLSECLPVLEAAKHAVGNIKKDNLNELRSLKLPPEAIRDVLEGVLRLMNNQDTSWVSMKKFLSQSSVINEILTFDARSITKQIREQVRQLLVSRPDSFRAESIARVSVAAAPMAAWVKAQIQYSLVLEAIEPFEKELKRLDTDLESARSRLEECAQDIRNSDTVVEKLKQEFGKLTQEAGTLQTSLVKAVETLAAATQLVGTLGDERDRWGIQLRELDSQVQALPVYTLLASGFITYLGGSPEDVRASMIETWSKALHLDRPFRLLQMMSTEADRLTWKAQELPGDDLSIENAIIVLNTRQYPLIIDPSSQATTWLLNKFSDSAAAAAQQQASNRKPGAGGAGSGAGAAEVTTQQDAKFLQKLELSVRFGKVLVIQEVDRLEPLLFPLLRRDLARQGPRLVIQVGEKTVDFNESFQLYMVTRNPMIEIPPDALPLVVSVNFSVTRSGLEGQLLGLTIKNEKPELEQEKSRLLRTEEEMKLKLSTLERQLLEQLASSHGSILENKALIQALTDTKDSSIKIKEALSESQELQEKLDKERDVYRGFAETGSRVFFRIQILKAINYMYQFDLPTYLSLFQRALESREGGGGGGLDARRRGGGAEDVTARINYLKSTLKSNVFSYVGRSLFKADRLTYGMYLVRGTNPELFTAEEWDFFIGLRIGDTSKSQPLPDWAPQDRVPALQRLAATVPALMKDMDLADKSAWQPWVESPTPEMVFPPRGRSLRPFQRLLVVQALRADRLQSAMEAFVCDGLGLQTVNAPTLDIAGLARETTASGVITPIMFIITPGADPSAILERAAEETLGPGKYRQLAMGQGQFDEALRMLRDGAEEGAWVCLQNVHLVVTWLPVLEKELHSLKPASAAFRLWLTTEPHPKFPPVLLQQSVKVTFEAPPGLKKNLLTAYHMWSSDFVSGRKDPQKQAWKARGQLLFLVAWFHAVVQERRTYIPQGWSKFHEFSFADLRSTAEIVTAFDPENPPWQTLRGLLENAIYGGRIDNGFDQRILRTYLEKIFSPECVKERPEPLPNTAIRVPAAGERQEFINLIERLPEVDTPGLFGLPLNVERVVQQSSSARITAQLKVMATAAVAEGGWDRDRIALQLAPLMKLWQTLIAGPGAAILRERKLVRAGSMRGGESGAGGGGSKNMNAMTAAIAAKSPVEAFAMMEADSAAGLVQRVHKALEAMDRVLHGTDLLSNAVRHVATRLAAGTVPPAWSDVWEGPETPALWLQAVIQKAQATMAWESKADRGEALTSAVRLSNLLAPQVFLNALRQQSAREMKVAVDELRLVCAWGEGAPMASVKAAGAPTCTIEGLVLQGALMETRLLTEARLDTPTVVPAPLCTVAFISGKQEDPLPDAGSVVVPLYEDLGRSRLLAQLRMPCKPEHKDKWVLAGIALFISSE